MTDIPKIVSREEAKNLGLTKYFTGEPCVSGHVDFRYTNTGICYNCKREQNRRCNKRNPERLKRASKRHYEKFREKCAAYSKEWVKNNRERSRAIKRACKEKHRDKYRQAEAKRMRDKRNNDLLFRLHRNISKEVWAVMKDKKQGKTWFSLLCLEEGV